LVKKNTPGNGFDQMGGASMTMGGRDSRGERNRKHV